MKSTELYRLIHLITFFYTSEFSVVSNKWKLTVTVLTFYVMPTVSYHISEIWFPAINMLRDQAPGTFVVRDSNSFPGAFGLALKVATPPPNLQNKTNDPASELVRHFLIEPTSRGVKLKGCSNEPVFSMYYYSCFTTECIMWYYLKVVSAWSCWTHPIKPTKYPFNMVIISHGWTFLALTCFMLMSW